MDTRAIDLIEAIAERLETVLGTFARDAEGAGSVRRLTPRSFGQTASARSGVTTSRANLACRLFQRTSAPRFPIVESDARVDADGRSSPRRWRCASAIGVETQNLYALTTARLVRPHSSHAGLSHASDSFEIDLVRKGGFEPPRSCERQPLKLVRLPVPPLPQVTCEKSRLKPDATSAAAIRLAASPASAPARARRARSSTERCRSSAIPDLSVP
jgi:hypothetical protein